MSFKDSSQGLLCNDDPTILTLKITRLDYSCISANPIQGILSSPHGWNGFLLAF